MTQPKNVTTQLRKDIAVPPKDMTQSPLIRTLVLLNIVIIMMVGITFYYVWNTNISLKLLFNREIQPENSFDEQSQSTLRQLYSSMDKLNIKVDGLNKTLTQKTNRGLNQLKVIGINVTSVNTTINGFRAQMLKKMSKLQQLQLKNHKNQSADLKNVNLTVHRTLDELDKSLPAFLQNQTQVIVKKLKLSEQTIMSHITNSTALIIDGLQSMQRSGSKNGNNSGIVNKIALMIEKQSLKGQISTENYLDKSLKELYGNYQHISEDQGIDRKDEGYSFDWYFERYPQERLLHGLGQFETCRMNSNASRVCVDDTYLNIDLLSYIGHISETQIALDLSSQLQAFEDSSETMSPDMFIRLITNKLSYQVSLGQFMEKEQLQLASINLSKNQLTQIQLFQIFNSLQQNQNIDPEGVLTLDLSDNKLTTILTKSKANSFQIWTTFSNLKSVYLQNNPKLKFLQILQQMNDNDIIIPSLQIMYVSQDSLYSLLDSTKNRSKTQTIQKENSINPKRYFQMIDSIKKIFPSLGQLRIYPSESKKQDIFSQTFKRQLQNYAWFWPEYQTQDQRKSIKSKDHKKSKQKSAQPNTRLLIYWV